MLKTIITVLLIFSSPPLLAQTSATRSFEEILFEQNRKENEQLWNEESAIMNSRIYRRGSHLIYDCEDKHFACVSPLSSQSCRNKRESDLKKKSLELRCAPLKAFDSTNECENTQRNVMLRLVKKEFCWNLSQSTLYEY
jgi:hypothetical protein